MSDKSDKRAELSQAHKNQVEAITRTVHALLPRLAPQGFTPEAVFEGVLKGAVMTMFDGRGLNKFDVADMFEAFAAGLRTVDDSAKGNLHVVK